jgi:hypothetical protein
MGRYDTHTIGSQVLVLPKDVAYTAPPVTGNYIDQLVAGKLNQDPHVAERSLHGRTVPPPGLGRHHRPPPDGRRVRGVYRERRIPTSGP